MEPFSTRLSVALNLILNESAQVLLSGGKKDGNQQVQIS